MSHIKCIVTLSTVDDSAGYQLQTVEIKDFPDLYRFLNQSDLRAKVQKITFLGARADEKAISVVVDSLVKK